MSSKKEILRLIEKSLSGKTDEEEERRLNELLAGENSLELSEEEEQKMENKMLNHITTSVHNSKRDRKSFVYVLQKNWKLIAASVTIFVIAGISYKNFKPKTEEIAYNKPVIEDIEPGSNKAVLTLSDGSNILLDDTQNGLLANENGAAISKKDGQITYQPDLENEQEVTAINTIATPRGGRYQVTLSDGTKVWLNAVSSLKFPAVFNNKERLVELSGEAYFEVAKNTTPFRVKAKNTTVEVLGTHFNVMAYQEEEALETTLLEGSVNIVRGNRQRILSPGEKAVCLDKNNTIAVSRADIEQAVGWKEGLFTFNNAPIEQVMRQIGRSYDADIVFEGEKPSMLFTGVLPIKEQVSKALSLITAASGVEFAIENQKIIVNKKKQ